VDGCCSNCGCLRWARGITFNHRMKTALRQTVAKEDFRRDFNT
jgi:hypothetical protein